MREDTLPATKDAQMENETQEARKLAMIGPQQSS
jgi:hypothetical protein